MVRPSYFGKKDEVLHAAAFTGIYEKSMFIAWFHKIKVVFPPTILRISQVSGGFFCVFGIATEHVQTLILHMSFV